MLTVATARLALTFPPPAGRARLVRCTAAPVVSGLAGLAERYDAVLLDQFGVLHDGQRALPGAVDCFERLAAAGKKLVVLSNTSRRKDFALRKLPALGFDPAMLTDFVCSGEEAWEAMRAGRRGQKVLWISWADDFQAWQPDYLDGCGLSLAPAETADFVLCHGSMVVRDGGAAPPASTDLLHGGEPSVALRAALATAAARGLPMLCANPDLHVILPSGELGGMPGLVAALYEQLGGTVTYYGKPHAPAFDACLASIGVALGAPVERGRVLHVGDSLAHDVAGANAAGVDSLFVAGGIHAAELGLRDGGEGGEGDAPEGGALAQSELEALFIAHGARPTYTTRSFVW